MFTDSRNLLRIILIALGLVIVAFICIFPAVTLLNRSGIIQAQVVTATPQQASDAYLQTLAARIVSTQSTAAPNTTQQIPVTGPTPFVPTPTVLPRGEGSLRVTYIDVLRGDAILLQTPDGKIALIDGGPAGGGALAYLQSHGIDHLDVMIATTPHADHLGGLSEILRAMPVTKVVTNGQLNAIPEYRDFLNDIAASEAQYFEINRGDFLTFENLRLEVLSPQAVSGEELNNNSLVLRLAHGEVSFLFMSDADSNADQALVASGSPLTATILKVGNHALLNSTNLRFLTAVDPDVAVYFAGRTSEAERPDPAVLDALAAAGARVFGTDRDGTIVVISDGSNYLVTPENALPSQYVRLPTPQPVVPVTGAVTITVSSVTNPARIGEEAALEIATAPGAVCTTVIFDNVSANGVSLGGQMANGEGLARWVWRSGRNASEGQWRAEVFCSGGGQAAVSSIPFTVVR